MKIFYKILEELCWWGGCGLLICAAAYLNTAAGFGVAGALLIVSALILAKGNRNGGGNSGGDTR